jgi:hypothetical protein
MCISVLGVVMYKCVRSGHVYVWYEWSCIGVLGVVMHKCARSGQILAQLSQINYLMIE